MDKLVQWRCGPKLWLIAQITEPSRMGLGESQLLDLRHWEVIQGVIRGWGPSTRATGGHSKSEGRSVPAFTTHNRINIDTGYGGSTGTALFCRHSTPLCVKCSPSSYSVRWTILHLLVLSGWLTLAVNPAHGLIHIGLCNLAVGWE